MINQESSVGEDVERELPWSNWMKRQQLIHCGRGAVVVCLASGRPWIQSPAPERGEEKERHILRSLTSRVITRLAASTLSLDAEPFA